MRPGQEPLAKNITRATCAHRRARIINLTDFLNFCARRLPHRPCHHHRDHVSHRRMDIIIVAVVASIGSAIAAPSSSSASLPPVADCTLVAVVVEVSLSSPTSEYRRHATLQHRSSDTITSIADAVSDDVIGRADATRIMSFAKQVAGGMVGCLREHWRGQLQVRQNKLHHIG